MSKRKIFCSILLVTMLISNSFWVHGNDGVEEAPLKILVIGNSFTNYAKNWLSQLQTISPYKESEFEFLSPGGFSLIRHLQTGEAMKKIKSSRWDYVIFHDQSQISGLPSHQKKFSNP